MAYGRFDELPERVFDQVVRTDLLGAAGSVRVALRHFRAAGAGTVILTGSVLGHITAPYMSAYVASKWGLQGLVRTVQQELRDSPEIRLCLVNPGSVDTPVYQQAANYLGRIGRPPPPVAGPQRVARAIVDCVDRPRREVSVGRLNVVLRAGLHRAAGGLRRPRRAVDAGGRPEWTAGRRARRLGLRREPGRRGGTRRPPARPAATRVRAGGCGGRRTAPTVRLTCSGLFGTYSGASCIDQLA